MNWSYPDPAAVVCPTSIPFRGGIPGGLQEGKLIEIRGTVPYGSDRFSVNLLTGFDERSDHVLHLSVRFNERAVIRNVLEHNSWGYEERQGIFPFHTGTDFKLMILVEPTCYRIAVNNQHCYEFKHRLPFTRVTTLGIDGGVQIERIEFVNKYSPFQPGTCFPTPSNPVFPGNMIPGIPATTGCIPPPIYPQPGIIPPPAVQICPQPPIQICPPSVSMGGSNLAPVYNPTIPFAYPIYGGLRPGMMVYISGRPSASAYKFTINFQSGTTPYPPPDIAFHLDVRHFNRTIVRNSRQSNVWDREETLISHFPFQNGVNFDMMIKVESDRYMVAVNGSHFIEFRHRIHPLSRFDTLYVENDIVVSSIRFG